MDKPASLISNSSWNGLSFLVGVGLNLLILPYVIFHLGIAEFGLAGLIAACVAPAMIFSNTLWQMVARELAQHLSLEHRSYARKVFATGLFLGLAIGLPIMLLLIVAGPRLAEHMFNLSTEHTKQLILAFACGGVGWMCQCLAGVFLAPFTARRDYARIAQVNIGSTLLATVLMWILVARRPFAATYLACQAAGFAASMIAGLWFARRNVPESLSMPRVHRLSLHRLANIGSWQVAAQCGGAFANQADRYLLGAFLPIRFVGFYNVSRRLEEAIYIGVLKIGEVLFPLFSSILHESEERQADTLFRSSWLLNLFAVSVLGGVITVAQAILRLWTNAEVALEGERVLVMLSLAGILGSGVNVFAFYLLGSGKTRANAYISIITALVTLLTSVLILPIFGWKAAGWSSCAGMGAQLIAMVWVMRRSFNVYQVNSRITHFVIMPLVVGVFCALGLRCVVAHVIAGRLMVWWQVVGSYAASAVVIGGAVVIAASLGPHGRICRRDLWRIVTHFMVPRVA